MIQSRLQEARTTIVPTSNHEIPHCCVFLSCVCSFHGGKHIFCLVQFTKNGVILDNFCFMGGGTIRIGRAHTSIVKTYGDQMRLCLPMSVIEIENRVTHFTQEYLISNVSF